MAGLEADVLPAQAEHLAATEAEDQDEDAGRVEAVSADRAKERDRFPRVPRRWKLERVVERWVRPRAPA
ncbi:hypothetical protein EASAB2608_03389 [Streptomyces sp. EAS-AB2608]|nr:hypothetical protein EASAB2608_03389 [Streptomyces sp. EAS-AB2608]